MTRARRSIALRGEVVADWKLRDLMADMARKRRTRGLDAYFRRQLSERRETMLQIADDIGTELGTQGKHDEAELAAMYGGFRSMLIAGLALVVSLGAIVSFA